MEERNWVVSPTLSHGSSVCLASPTLSDNDSTITQQSSEVGMVKPSSRKTINALLSDMFIDRVGELLEEGCGVGEVEQTAARGDDDDVERTSINGKICVQAYLV